MNILFIVCTNTLFFKSTHKENYDSENMSQRNVFKNTGMVSIIKCRLHFILKTTFLFLEITLNYVVQFCNNCNTELML